VETLRKGFGGDGMKKVSGSLLLLVLLLVMGIIFGNIIGNALSSSLPFLAEDIELGLKPPLSLNLDFISIVLGFTIKINLAGILGALLAILVFRKI